MKLFLDEDSQGKLLVRLLRAAGHDVETVFEAGIAGSDDLTVLAYAKRAGRVLLTRNGRDFLLLHQDADPSKNMTYPQIAAAIGKIDSSGWNIAGEFVSLNAWQ